MQHDLFPTTAGEEYDPFGELPEDYPFRKFKTKHSTFNRKAHVSAEMGTSARKFFVNLSIGECDCPRGHAWSWDNKNSKWYNNAYCPHKLKVIASIVDKWVNKDTKQHVFDAYIQAVGTRYNQWEVVSAFHKELRRGDFNKAFFWGLILSVKRSYGGVIKYLCNIVYEETRDHVLAEILLTLASRKDNDYDTVAKAIRLFCASTKKWELPWRLEIFQAEMKGYQQLVKEYGPEVAKGGNIIPVEQKASLLNDLKRGLATKNLVKMQHGLKGLQKLKYDNLETHRYWLYEQLYDYADAMVPCTDGSVWDIIEVINLRISTGHGVGYHELNALADCLAGEAATGGNTPSAALKIRLRAPSPPYPLGIWPAIPLYAQDNHTYRGKALLRRFPEELEPGADQVHLDFHLCGAYYGVAWRMLAYNQHGTIDVPWGKVKWPIWLISTVKSLWY